MSTSTSPVLVSSASHRTDAPVWAFHLLVAQLSWMLAVVLYSADVLEHRVAGHRVTVIAVSLFATVLAVSVVFGMMHA